MSYNQIFRRLSRFLQSSVHATHADSVKTDEEAFDEELRNTEQQSGSAQTKDAHSNQQQKQRQQNAGGTTEGRHRPGERDDAHYLAVLGLTPSATNDEIRKAYRKLMGQYHPDRVATLGPDLQKAAGEKSQVINEAFMIIERRRGMK